MKLDLFQEAIVNRDFPEYNITPTNCWFWLRHSCHKCSCPDCPSPPKNLPDWHAKPQPVLGQSPVILSPHPLAA
jgi:hypothetical protein